MPLIEYTLGELVALNGPIIATAALGLAAKWFYDRAQAQEERSKLEAEKREALHKAEMQALLAAVEKTAANRLPPRE